MPVALQVLTRYPGIGMYSRFLSKPAQHNQMRLQCRGKSMAFDIGNTELHSSLFYNSADGAVVDVADVWEEVMFDLTVKSAKEEGS